MADQPAQLGVGSYSPEEKTRLLAHVEETELKPNTLYLVFFGQWQFEEPFVHYLQNPPCGLMDEQADKWKHWGLVKTFKDLDDQVHLYHARLDPEELKKGRKVWTCDPMTKTLAQHDTLVQQLYEIFRFTDRGAMFLADFIAIVMDEAHQVRRDQGRIPGPHEKESDCIEWVHKVLERCIAGGKIRLLADMKKIKATAEVSALREEVHAKKDIPREHVVVKYKK